MAGKDAGNFRLLAHHPLPLRLICLFVGLAFFGIACGLVIESQMGNFPWDVLHQGLSLQSERLGFPLTIGTVGIIMSILVLLLWIPLKQRPGLGTVCNAFLVGIFIDLTMAVVPDITALWLQILVFVVGVLLNGFATVLYIIPNFGPGPRDGLMTGLVERTGWSVGPVRAGIEVIVLATGWLLGGNLWFGTLVIAFGIGYIAQYFLRLAERIIGPVDPLTTDAD